MRNLFQSIAAALATMDILEREAIGNAARVGAQIMERLESWKHSHPSVGDVRGRGLMIGIELVRDLDSKELFGKKVTELIFSECLKRGLVIMGYFPKIRNNPALVITEAQADAGIGILDEVFAHVRDHVDWRHA